MHQTVQMQIPFCKYLKNRKNIGFIFIYSGLLIVIIAAFLGSFKLQRLQMVVLVNSAEWRATNEKKEIVELPFVIELKSFTIDEYPSGKPKCFTSDVTVYLQNQVIINALIKVNKPLSVAGWKIYQMSYDKTQGKNSTYSVFQLVKDPWLPAVYTGIFLMLAGAVFMLISGLAFNYRNYRKSFIFTILGIVLFAVLIARMWLSPERTQNLMPALQSIWFVPHIMAYMLAYSILGVATMHAIYLLIRPKKQLLFMPLCDSLVYIGTAFLTMGMLIGAIWAKEVWGHYWSWDPKETFALATWLAYLFYIHFRLIKPAKIRIAICLLIFAFLMLQMCWFGVKYLPALGKSIHIYR